MGPLLGPYYNTGPNTGPNLGDPKRDHNFDNAPHVLSPQWTPAVKRIAATCKCFCAVACASELVLRMLVQALLTAPVQTNASMGFVCSNSLLDCHNMLRLLLNAPESWQKALVATDQDLGSSQALHCIKPSTQP